jgi:hypothetical protein
MLLVWKVADNVAGMEGGLQCCSFCNTVNVWCTTHAVPVHTYLDLDAQWTTPTCRRSHQLPCADAPNCSCCTSDTTRNQQGATCSIAPVITHVLC